MRFEKMEIVWGEGEQEEAGMTHGDERYAGIDPEVDVDPEVEEDGETQLRESLERDDGFGQV